MLPRATMETSSSITAEVCDATAGSRSRLALAGVLSLALAVGALFFYKWSGAFRALQKTGATGKLALTPDAITQGGVLAATGHYFARVWPALAFGIVIGALVRTTVSPTRIAAWLGGRGMRPSISGAQAGSPRMRC